jgi:hypothetical protein
MQERYRILKGLDPLIRRKDQGEHGMFYVAQVGPYRSQEDALKMCELLKTAGGSCFVLHN